MGKKKFVNAVEVYGRYESGSRSDRINLRMTVSLIPSKSHPEYCPVIKYKKTTDTLLKDQESLVFAIITRH